MRWTRAKRIGAGGGGFWMGEASREPVALNYARPPRPKPRDWGAWGWVAFALVVAIALCFAALLAAIIIE
jgi:hypothetical protein